MLNTIENLKAPTKVKVLHNQTIKNLYAFKEIVGYVTFANCNFVGETKFLKSKFINARFINCTFDTLIFSGCTRLKQATLEHCTINHLSTNKSQPNFENCTILEAL